MKTKRFFAFLLSVLFLFSAVPFTGAAVETVTTQYVKVNSVDEIVPNVRYVIVGTYTNPDTGEESYHLMGKENNPSNGFRYSYAQDQDGTHHFDMSEDKNHITVYTYPSYDPILRLRITPRDDEGRFYLGVDGEGYLCGFSNSASDGAVGHDRHSCMPISTRTVGELWWYMRVVEEGDYAGDWQIVNRSKLGSYRGYYYDVMRMSRPYPNYAGQFRAERAYIEDVGVIDEYDQIKYTEDYDTNIWLYREICTHRPAEVMHTAAVEASCSHPGNIEHWFCTGCEAYASDADFQNLIHVSDIFIPAVPHTESCGHADETVKFELCTEYSMGSNQSGERYLLIGKSGDKYYAMGNITNPDGSRNAVEVPVNENGILIANSNDAEFITFDYDDGVFGYLVDGGYFSASDGKIIVYDKALYNTSDHVPGSAAFDQEDSITGLGSFYARSSRDTETQYIVFDEETLSFRSQTTRSYSTYRYRELCPHEKSYQPAVEATCTRCGNIEYWYCSTCYKYFGAADGSITLDENTIRLHATDHTETEDGCENCDKGIPVYSKITSKDQLGQPGTYIIVATDGTNTYVLQRPANLWEDLNGNGIPDMEEVDENENEIPDIYEKDSDGDGEPDIWDSDHFESFAIPVTPNEDGTISVHGLGAAEFEMIDAEYDFKPEEKTAKQYYFWMPNNLLNGLNEICVHPACFPNGGDVEGADETSAWGISFGNALSEEEKNDLERAHFTVGDENAVMYAENCANGATRPLRLRIYEGKPYFVTEYDAWLPGATEQLDKDGNVIVDEYGEPFYDTHDEQYAVYLYYAAGVGGDASVPGDMDGDEEVTPVDALYLLRHVLMPTIYPVSRKVDVNGDGVTNATDAIYLLRHVLLPHLYPLT